MLPPGGDSCGGEGGGGVPRGYPLPAALPENWFSKSSSFGAHRQVFRLFDDDHTNTISFKNLQRVARELGENLTDEELQEMVDEADRDGAHCPSPA